MRLIFNFLIVLIALIFSTACSEKHDYVDLGLPSGTMWATYNVGASTPTEVGFFFAWGETDPKDSFSWDNYKWGSKKNLKKYCTESAYGIVDSLSALKDEDDAATANWGSEWRMPSIAEIEELFKSCNWEMSDNYQGSGVGGMIGTSRYNKEKIFLPLAKIAEWYERCNGEGKYIYRTYFSENESNEQRKIVPVSYISRELGFSNTNVKTIGYNEYPGIGIYDVYRFIGANIRAVRTTKIGNEEKNTPKIFKEVNGLAADSVAEFHVVGNYQKQSLTISGYFNQTTDWTYNYIDTIVVDSVMYMMVRGVDTQKNKTIGPHKSAFFKQEYKIPSNINEVVFGPTIERIWKRNCGGCDLKGEPAAEMVKVIESTFLSPHYYPKTYKIKEEDNVTSVRCSDTSEFESLMPEGYIFNGVFSSCDVNKDGKTDYLLAIEGPYNADELEYWKKSRTEGEKTSHPNEDVVDDDNYEEVPKHAYEGIMLVINEGDTSFVSDIWNSGCFYAVDEDGGAYIAPDLVVSAHDDQLEIHYGFGRNGYWKYSFVYRDGNYQLIKDIHGGAYETWFRCMDLEKGIDEERDLKSAYPCKPEEDEQQQFEVSKFGIKRAFKYTLTNIATFTI
ncbi:MAG: hypothetical protein MJZ33_10405 [Paludibacteraceae bacterium]|nr:hypothetical protein [Paludibacteraceae bacterium]